MNLEEKINIVKDILKDRKVAVGFSGGADSTLIAYLASQVSADVLAITIDNHLFPSDFLNHARSMCEKFKITHHVIDLNFYEDDEFLNNSHSRCHSCRNLMYEKIKEYALEKGFDFICDGNNISDLVIDRPGILVTYKMEFNTPLIEAKLTSKEIHEYLNENGISYSKSTTCLATRIATGTRITENKIEKIKQGEEILSQLSKRQLVKVRDNDELCICELDSFSHIMNDESLNEINNQLKSLGYKKVCLNLSALDDDEDIDLDYKDNGFQYQLPYTINIENTKKQLENNILAQNSEMIKLEKIAINKNGLIEGYNLNNYNEALFEFMEILAKIRRNV